MLPTRPLTVIPCSLWPVGVTVLSLITCTVIGIACIGIPNVILVKYRARAARATADTRDSAAGPLRVDRTSHAGAGRWTAYDLHTLGHPRNGVWQRRCVGVVRVTPAARVSEH